MDFYERRRKTIQNRNPQRTHVRRGFASAYQSAKLREFVQSCNEDDIDDAVNACTILKATDRIFDWHVVEEHIEYFSTADNDHESQSLSDAIEALRSKPPKRLAQLLDTPDTSRAPKPKGRATARARACGLSDSTPKSQIDDLLAYSHGDTKEFGECFPFSDERILMSQFIPDETNFWQSLAWDCEPDQIKEMLLNTAVYIFFDEAVGMYSTRNTIDHSEPTQPYSRVWNYALNDLESIWKRIFATPIFLDKLQKIRDGEEPIPTMLSGYLTHYFEAGYGGLSPVSSIDGYGLYTKIRDTLGLVDSDEDEDEDEDEDGGEDTDDTEFEGDADEFPFRSLVTWSVDDARKLFWDDPEDDLERAKWADERAKWADEVLPLLIKFKELSADEQLEEYNRLRTATTVTEYVWDVMCFYHMHNKDGIEKKYRETGLSQRYHSLGNSGHVLNSAGQFVQHDGITPRANMNLACLRNGSVADAVRVLESESDLRTPNYSIEDPRSPVAEAIWEARNRPTYRIWPSWVETFKQSKLVDFPSRIYAQPYSSILVVLPKEKVLTFESYPVRWMMLSLIDNDALIGTAYEKLTPKPHIETPMIFLEIEIGRSQDKEPHKMFDGSDLSSDPTELVPYEQYVQRMLGTFGHDEDPTLRKYCALPYDTEMSLADQLEHYDLDNDLRDCWAVALSVAYLGANQYKLIEPDVLKADIDKYLRFLAAKDTEGIARLHAKATRKRRSVGFTIGRNTDSIFRILGQEAKGGGAGTGNGHELKHRHIRKFHFRRISGTNEDGNRYTKDVVPVMEAIVRPDLPPKHYDLNHRSLDDDGK